MRFLITLFLAVFITPTIISAEPLDLCSAWQRVCCYSPRINARSFDIEALEGEHCQASLYPNPEFSLQVDNFAGSRFYHGCDAADVIVGISQPIVTADKIYKRSSTVNALITQAEWDLESDKLALREELERAFILVAVLQERTLCSKKNNGIACAAAQAAQHLVESGKSSIYQQKKAAIAMRASEVSLQKAKLELERAKKTLAQLWGACDADFDYVSYPLYEIVPLPSLETLLCSLSATPAVQTSQAAICVADKALATARAEQYPDFLFSLGYKSFRDCGDHAFFVEIDVPLPIFDRNQGNIKRAEALRCKAEFEKVYVYNQSAAELKAAYEVGTSAYERACQLKEGLLAELEEAVSMTMEGYNEGKLGYIDLLDSQRLLFESYQDYLEALLEYHQSRAAIRRLTAAATLTRQG